MPTILSQILKYLTKVKSPDSELARQEYIVKLVLVVMAAALSVFTLLVAIAVWMSDLPVMMISIMFALLLFTLIGWVLAHLGMIRLGRVIPPALTFVLGIYGSIDNGLVSTGLLFYVLSILLTAILYGKRAQWFMVILCSVTHFGIVWIWGERAWDQYVNVAISTIGSFVGISLLFWYYSKRLQDAIDQARIYANALKQKTDDLYLANQELQVEVDKHNQAKEALVSSYRLLEGIYDTIPDPIIWTDPDEIIVSCNKQVQRVFGYSPQDLVGQKIDVLSHDGDLSRSELEESKSLLQEQGYFEQRFLTVRSKQGRIFRSNVSVGQIKDDTGQILGYVGSIRDITEQIQTREEIQKRTAQLEALRETGLELAAQLDLEDLFNSIVVRAIELMNADAGGIYLYRPEIDLLERSFSIGPCVPPVGAMRRRGEGLSGTVWESGESLHLLDYRTWEGRIYDKRQVVPKGVVGTPIQWGDEFLGVLVVSTLPSSDRLFLPIDVETLGLFSTQVAIAINNARLYQSVGRNARHLTLINRIAWAAGSTLDLNDLLEIVYQEISQVFVADAFFIALYDENKSELDFRLAMEKGKRIFFGVKPLGVGLTSQVITRGESILIKDFESESELRSIAIYDGELKPASWLATPIKIGERVLGVINVQSKSPFAYGDEDLLLFSTISDQVAMAIENARLYEETDHLLSFNENIVQGIQEGIVISDSNGVLTFLNPAAARILDYEVDDLLGRPWTSIIHPDHTSILAPIKFEQGKSAKYEIELACRDGQPLHALINSRPLLNKDSGQYEGTLSTFVDITDRVRAEKQRDKNFCELQHRLEFEKVVSDISTLFVRSTDLDKTIDATLEATGKLAGANRAYLYLLRNDGLVVDNTHEWCSEGMPSQRDLLQNIPIEQYSWGFERMSLEKEFIVKDVSRLPAEAEAVKGFLEQQDIGSLLALPVYTGGSIIGFIGFNNASSYDWSDENVTLLRLVSELIGNALDRNKAEKERIALLAQIQEQANQIKQTIESVPEGVLLLDSSQRIMIENLSARNYLSILNGSDRDTAGLDGQRILSHIGDTELAELLNSVGEHWSEIKVEGFIFELFIRPITHAPEAGGWVLVLRDVTQERVVQERVQQRDRLAAVGQLAAGIAHDFNNIMAVILLYAQLSMQEKNLPANVEERLEIVIEQSQHATRLINQILDFSRSAILVRESIDLAPLLKEQVKLIQRTLPE
ncbi:MAG: GAF domain-containing protein, partial [Anaerolineales bacterium]|nr:GAF domain-containing protein [Anaerolineales bacterium]